MEYTYMCLSEADLVFLTGPAPFVPILPAQNVHNLFIIFPFYFLCSLVFCLHVCLRTSDHLGLELQTAVSYNVGVERAVGDVCQIL